MSKVFSVRWFRSPGSGGQKKNKTANCCIITHIETGLTAKGDCRSRKESHREAMKLMLVKIKEAEEAEKAAKRKGRRDERIKNQKRVRTYDYSRGIVIDHRTGKTASLKDILIKGLLDKLK